MTMVMGEIVEELAGWGGRGAVWDNESTGQECALGERVFLRGNHPREPLNSLVAVLKAALQPKSFSLSGRNGEACLRVLPDSAASK
jgi:hypothetical protein